MIKNILFDWSGTLMDDLTTTYKATVYIFEKLGGKPMSFKEYRKSFFLPYMNFWKQHFPDCTKEQINQLFREGLDASGDTGLYPGVKDMLKRLHDKGIKMGVISSGPQEKIIADAKRYSVFDYFQEINGTIADKAEVITDILQRNNFKPEETMYVGDMPHDIEAGKKGGVVSIGICWGHKSKEMLEAANPDHLISDITELEKLID
jgi:phosphoglycolate phosphatase